MRFQVSGSSQLCRNRSLIAGYGIKCYLICQDINQLQAHHGGEEAITSNCHIQIAFPPNRLETAEHLAKLIGQNTVVKEQVRTSGNSFWWTQPCIEDAARGPTSAPAAERM